MAFAWKDFLGLARFLQLQLQSNPDFTVEAGYRCAIGRAYYAAFGHARHYAETWLGFQGKSRSEDKSQEHGSLKAFLRSKRRRSVAESLDVLRISRNRCDYEQDEKHIDWHQDLLALRRAEYVLQSLPPPQERIKQDPIS